MRRIAYYIIALALSGCSQWQAPATVTVAANLTPPQWTEHHLNADIVTNWPGIGHYPQLVNYIQEALAYNPQLLSRRQDIDIAVASAQQTEAGQWPQLSALLTGGRQDGGTGVRNSNSINLELNWQLDWLGKLDDLSRAATLDAQYAVLGYRRQQSTTIANISRLWFNLITAQQQAALIDKRQHNLKLNLDIIENGYDQGLNMSLDVYLARADLARARAAKQQQLSELLDARRQLEITLGRYPSASITANGDLNFSQQQVPAGLPSTLLLRRHDIQQSMAKLTASNYRVAHAYKNRFPNLSLSLNGGASSPALNDLLRPESLIWSLFANAAAPLFDAGALAAKQAQQVASARQAAITVTATTLQAFNEVEAALANEATLAKQQIQQQAAQDYFSTAEQLAFEQYLAGISGYITVLESQRSAFDADTNLIAIKNSRIQNRIELLFALGGDIPPDLIHATQEDVDLVSY